MAMDPAAPPRPRCIARIRLPPAWTPEEDARLQRLAKENGFRHWHSVARRMPGRSHRLCRSRWRHHLARDLYHRPFTACDDDELRRLVARFGGTGRWKDIGRAVYGRTSGVMKRRWKEIRNNAGAAKTCCPPALPSNDQDLEESGQTAASSYADDVLASSFVSCSLTACDAPVDPRAGSLALGFACMAV